MKGHTPQQTYHHLRVDDVVDVDFVRWVDGAGMSVTGPFTGVVQSDDGDRFSIRVQGCSVPGTLLRRSLVVGEGSFLARFFKQSGTEVGTTQAGGRFRLR